MLLSLLSLAVLSLLATPGSARSTSGNSGVKFYLYSKLLQGAETNYHKFYLDVEAEDLTSAGFNASSDTKILIHGFASGVDSDGLQAIRYAYAAAGHAHNVLVVDWSALTLAPLYLASRVHMQTVAQDTANLVDYMVSEGLVSLERLHIIGHSLGAHVAGLAAKKMESAGKVGRITGLDPARPMFNMKDNRSHLIQQDATLVDVIHTNAGFLGAQMRLGHIDFYANGGKWQPGCGWEDLLGICSHGRSFLLFAESITNSTAFKAYRCTDEWDALHGTCKEGHEEGSGSVWATMGNSVSFSQSGSYYLDTGSSSPYANL